MRSEKWRVRWGWSILGPVFLGAKRTDKRDTYSREIPAHVAEFLGVKPERTRQTFTDFDALADDGRGARPADEARERAAEWRKLMAEGNDVVTPSKRRGRYDTLDCEVPGGPSPVHPPRAGCAVDALAEVVRTLRDDCSFKNGHDEPDTIMRHWCATEEDVERLSSLGCKLGEPLRERVPNPRAGMGWVCELNWKDADLEPTGCTGIERIEADGARFFVHLTGHKTVCPPSEESVGWDDRATDALMERTSWDSVMDVAQEIVCGMESDSGNWTGDDWSLSRESVIVVKMRKGEPVDRVARRIYDASVAHVEAEWEPSWIEGDQCMSALYDDVATGKYMLDEVTA